MIFSAWLCIQVSKPWKDIYTNISLKFNNKLKCEKQQTCHLVRHRIISWDRQGNRNKDVQKHRKTCNKQLSKIKMKVISPFKQKQVRHVIHE